MKYLTLITLVLATTAQADFWDNCTAYGGTIITANKYGADQGGLCNNPSNPDLTNNCNGKRFCVGPKMNWWSAFTWCEAIGGKLASFANACPGAQTNSSGTCANLKGTESNWIWIGTGWLEDRALRVLLSTGTIYQDTNRDTTRTKSTNRAFCEE